MEEVTVNRTRKRDDWALQIKRLADEDYPDAKKIILVCDNLNTHNAASLYQAFRPEEARRIWKRIDLHHTPKHGLWLGIYITVPKQEHRLNGETSGRGDSMVCGQKQKTERHRLAVQCRRCKVKAQTFISCDRIRELNVTDY